MTSNGERRRWHYAFILFLLGLLFISALAHLSPDKVSGQAGRQEFYDLQARINQTTDNGTLYLEPGIYHGNVVIDKPLTLVGSGETVIRGDGTGDVLTITASGVTVKNVHIENSSFSRNFEDEFAGIKILSNDNLVQNVTIQQAFHGVYLRYADHNRLINITATGQGFGIIGGQGNGIHALYAHHNEITKSQFTGFCDGIYLDNADHNVIQDNLLQENRYGFHTMYASSNKIIGNRFVRNTGGAAIMHSREGKIKDNTFIFHQGPRSFALLLQASNQHQVHDNRFYFNQRALYADHAHEHRVAANLFAANKLAVELWGSSGYLTFTQNRFVQNVITAVKVGGHPQQVFWSEAGKGNYWGVPLLDLDQDGVGDIPFQYQSALSQLVEQSEMFHLFINSPALTLYEQIQRILERQEVVLEDPYPLIGRGGSAYAQWWMAAAALILSAGWYEYRSRRRMR